ncbi:GNAT family N-acetyltransferase [Romboutsia sedimentorum]|uniref:GNAT family N-acetyltransferase n=1 Tax=Romboutsia sedimentorum TaxID=1368474 RepID=UPI0024DEA352|nr:GNAT family N-acetyltransferase [Romboutsia sedimentorum]MDK2584286.1 GNAT family N-acetyltransferase [Romboutsia sedimentorum]
MNAVVYRDLDKKDYDRIKELIAKAFGFDKFIEDENFLDLILNIYLQNCILASSFSKVAVKDNNVIGIILGDAKKDKNRIRKFHNSLSVLYTTTKLIFSNEENKRILKEFAKITSTYKEIIQGKKEDFQGCIQLFIVSEESRGLGVGKSLISYLSNYMKSMDVKSLYLYTDNRCNYGFYDNQNFNRINEKKVYFDTIQAYLDVFLYSYNFN